MKRTFGVLAAVIIGSPLLAQDSAFRQPLEEVVVTANKYPSKTSTTGKVISVITRQQLERSGGKDLAQLLNEQAGLSINGANSNPGKDKSVYLRGARVDHTLITIDGIPVYDPSGIGGIFDIRNLALENIERIEILRGSQSTLYGSDAIAGVINIITRKAAAKKLQGSGLFSYGSNNTVRGNLRVDGSTGKFSYSAGFTEFKSRGINETTSTGITDRDGYHQQSQYANFGYRSGTVSLQTFFRNTKLTGDIDQGAFTDELDYTYKQRSTQAGLKAQWNTGKVQWNLLYQYNRISRTYTDDSTKSRNGFDIYSQGKYSGGEHFAELYTVVPLHTNLKWIIGTDLRQSQSDQSYVSVSSFGPYSTNYAKDSLQQQQYGFYSALQLSLPSGFSAEAGGRINHHSVYSNNAVFNLNPSLFIRRQVKLFANISSGFRTPSLYQLFSEYGNRGLKPETALNTEAGVQFFSKGQRYSARMTVFNREVRNLLFFSYNPVTFQSQYINQDKQKDHGLELELAAAPNEKLSLKAFYTYVTGKITTKNGGKDTTYNNLLRRPAHSITLNAGYQVSKPFFVSVNLNYAGERKDAYFDANSFQTVQATLKAYALLDLYMEYQINAGKAQKPFPVTGFVELRNLTNSRFTEVSGFRTLGFNAYAGLRLRF